jgi:hypothetical protein
VIVGLVFVGVEFCNLQLIDCLSEMLLWILLVGRRSDVLLSTHPLDIIAFVYSLVFTIVFSRCLVFLEPLNYYELPISFTFSQMIVLSLKNASLAFPPL